MRGFVGADAPPGRSVSGAFAPACGAVRFRLGRRFTPIDPVGIVRPLHQRLFVQRGIHRPQVRLQVDPVRETIDPAGNGAGRIVLIRLPLRHKGAALTGHGGDIHFASRFGERIVDLHRDRRHVRKCRVGGQRFQRLFEPHIRPVGDVCRIGYRRLHPSPFGGFVVRDVKLAFEPFQILANGLGKLFPDGNRTIAPFLRPVRPDPA